MIALFLKTAALLLTGGLLALMLTKPRGNGKLNSSEKEKAEGAKAKQE